MMTLKKGHSSTKGDYPEFKKISVCESIYDNENPILKFVSQTDRQTSAKQYAPSTFPKVDA